MAVITFQCSSCNQMLKVGSDKGGKKTKCIKCGTILTIPTAADPEIVAPAKGPAKPPSGKGATPPPAKTPAPKAPAKTPAPAGRKADDAKFEEEEPPRRRRPREEDDEDDDRPRRRRPREEEDYEEEDRPRPRRRDEESDEDDEDRPSRRRRGDDYDEEEDDRPRRRERDEDEGDEYDVRRSARRTDWSKVRLGFMITYIALFAFALVFLVEQVGVIVLTKSTLAARLDLGGVAQPGVTLNDLLRSGDRTALTIIRVAVSAMPVALIAIIAGQVFLIFTDNRKGALLFAIAALSVSVIALGVMVYFKTLGAFRSEERLPNLPYAYFILRVAARAGFEADLGQGMLLGVVNVLLAVMFLMMAFYLRAQALNRADSSLASTSMFLVVLSSIAVVYQLLWPVMVNTMFDFRLPTKGPQAVTWVVYWIGALLTFLLVLVLAVGARRGLKATERRKA